MGNINGWKMVDRETGETVEPDTERKNFRGDTYKLIGAAQAPAGNSEGRVVYFDPEWKHSEGKQYCYPSVFGVKLVPDVTVPDTPEGVQRDPRIEALVNDVAEELSKLGMPDGATVANVRVESMSTPSGIMIHNAMGEAINRVGEKSYEVLADAMAEIASVAYFAGLRDGKAGLDGPQGGCVCGNCEPDDDTSED